MEGRQTKVQIFEAPHRLVLSVEGAVHEFLLPDPFDGESGDAGGGERLVAPMPGFIKQVRVAAGDVVAKGQALVVMEAMKMELTLTAGRDGTVETVDVGEGDQVNEGALLVLLHSEEA